MASSMLTADRRVASTRRSGMTILGKIPKPINLPSQRLENNGVDPNVEIVPKGTHSWAKTTPFKSQNAWSSSSPLSPRIEGGAGTPSNNSGRPSSGGSGTRPSTAGSDTAELNSTWGLNPCPSTASDLFTSTHSSLPGARPHSAETRPGSSQLSRFAGNSVGGIVSGGSTRAPEDLGPYSSDGFTLNSGDFPTLGSEKIPEMHSQRGHSSQGRPLSASGNSPHGRPMSSGAEAPTENCRDTLSGTGNDAAHSNFQGVNILRKDEVSVGGCSTLYENMTEHKLVQLHPNYMEKQHFNVWGSPLSHSTEGIWPRGPQSGPYRLPEHPTSHPVDPSACYPQYEPGCGTPARPVGSCRSNADMYCPQNFPPNSYVLNQPVSPVRAAAFHAPVSFGGSFGPPQAGFHNSADQHVRFMAVAPLQPGFFNRPIRGHVQRLPERVDPVTPKEQKISSDPVHGVHQGQNMVLAGQWHNKLECIEPHAMAPTDGTNDGYTSRMMSSRDGWNENCKQDVPVTTPEEVVKAVLCRESKDDPKVLKKNTTLIEKIESLNNKARGVDPQSVSRASKAELSKDNNPQLGPSNIVLTENRAERGTSAHGIHSFAGKTCQRLPVDGKGILGPPMISVSKPNRLATDQKPVPLRNFNEPVTAAAAAATLVFSNSSRDGSSNFSPGNNSSGSSVSTCKDDLWDQVLQPGATQESNATNASMLDGVTQHVQLREKAAQHAKRLQEEEEERTRQQKAKAAVKLEELNRRSLMQVTQKETTDISTADRQQEKQVMVVESSGSEAYNNVPPATNQEGVMDAEEFLRNSSLSSKNGGAKQQRHAGSRRRQNALRDKTHETEALTYDDTDKLKAAIKDSANLCSVDDTKPKNFPTNLKNGKNSNSRIKSVAEPAPLGSMSMVEVVVSGQSSGKLSEQEQVRTTDAMSGNQPIPQLLKTSARNQRVRTADKAHGPEAVMWTPVKTQTKSERKLETDCKDGQMVVCTTQPSEKSSGELESVSKTKRAEMERYVPKPLTKELLQHYSVSVPGNHVAPGDISEKMEISDKFSEKDRLVKLTSDKNLEDKRAAKHSKGHSWRKRNPSDSSGQSVSSTELLFEQEPSGHHHHPGNNSISIKDREVPSRPNHQQANKVHGVASDDFAWQGKNPEESAKDDNYSGHASVAALKNEPRNSMKSDNKSFGASVQLRTQWRPKSNVHAPTNIGGTELEIPTPKLVAPVMLSDSKNSKVVPDDNKGNCQEDDTNNGLQDSDTSGGVHLNSSGSHHQGSNNYRYGRWRASAHRERNGDYESAKQNHEKPRSGAAHFKYKPVSHCSNPSSSQQ